MFKKKYDLEDDIKQTREQLKRIAMLRELTNFPAWKEVDELFRDIIGVYARQIMELCSDPVKNSHEIRCKQMVMEALSSFLAAINGKVDSISELQKNLEYKIGVRSNLDKPII